MPLIHVCELDWELGVLLILSCELLYPAHGDELGLLLLLGVALLRARGAVHIASYGRRLKAGYAANSRPATGQGAGGAARAGSRAGPRAGCALTLGPVLGEELWALHTLGGGLG
jgi:hypothetical protein